MTETERRRYDSCGIGSFGNTCKCKYAHKAICNDEYKIWVCDHEPYKGKRIAEIEKCPASGERM